MRRWPHITRPTQNPLRRLPKNPEEVKVRRLQSAEGAQRAVA